MGTLMMWVSDCSDRFVALEIRKGESGECVVPSLL